MSKIITIPATIDPHVHFRTPGGEYKEDFTTGANSAKFGGRAVVLDMPNTNPATTNEEQLDWKIDQTSKIYSSSGAPAESRSSSRQARTVNEVEFGFQFGVTTENLEEIKRVESKVKALKVFFGSSTGNLLVNDLGYLEKLMRETTKIITIHAEDEEIIQKNMKKYAGKTDPKIHSLIRDPESAISATEKMLGLVRKTGHPVYFCHVSTKGEIDLIKKAKLEGLKVYAEVTPHHLFLDTSYYKKFGNFVKVNPPIRDKEDVKALWEAINDGVIDTIGSDHAPHLPGEKEKGYWEAPSGMPGTETALPLMLNEVNKGNITLEKVIELMSTNPARIFEIDLAGKEITIDMDLTKEVKGSELHSKCGWTPYEGRILTGWPVIK